MTTQSAARARKTFMFDAGAETMPRPALAALQAERLRGVLQRAYAKVPH